MTDTHPTPTPAEQEEIDRANTSGKQPVVFVHGLWLLDSSWDRWAAFFEDAGYVEVSRDLCKKIHDVRSGSG